MSRNNKETAAQRLERMRKEKENATSNQQNIDHKKEILSQITGKESTMNFDKIATELEIRKEQEKEKQAGLNDGFVKDTIYIQEEIYKAFNALCLTRGDKKKFTNEALIDFVYKKYAEINNGKSAKDE